LGLGAARREQAQDVQLALGQTGRLEGRFQIEAVNSPSGVTHVTFSRR
jgi:hypothetical protein